VMSKADLILTQMELAGSMRLGKREDRTRA